jgi:ABC-type Na+ efflux pump permease subunit
MKKTIKKISFAMLVLFPVITFAEGKDLNDLVQLVGKYLNAGVGFILSLAVVMFIYNVFKYFIAGGDNAESKKEAGLYVMWSIIGFFVILSFWGLVRIVTNTFKLDSQAPTDLFGNFSSSNVNSNTNGSL